MAAYLNPRIGDAISTLLGAQNDPAAVGQARVYKAQMDRQNQETLAREALGDAILRGGMNPREFSTNLYGNAVKISDGFAGIAPEFNRGAQMGIYGTEGLGTRMAADLFTGAGGAFSSTELGQQRTIAGQNARNAADNARALQEAQIEANAPVVLSEGELYLDPSVAEVGPEGYLRNNARVTLGPEERMVAGGPGLGEVVVPAVPGYNEADMRATDAQAQERLGSAALSNADAERTRADIAAGAPAADVSATRAGAERDRAEAGLAQAQIPYEATRSDMAEDILRGRVEQALGEAALANADARRTNADVDAGAPQADVRAAEAGAELDRARAEEARRPPAPDEVEGIGVGDDSAFLNMEDRSQLADAARRAMLSAGMDEQIAGNQDAQAFILDTARRIVLDPNAPSSISAALDQAVSAAQRRGLLTLSGGGLLGPSVEINRGRAPGASTGAGVDPAPDVGYRIVE